MMASAGRTETPRSGPRSRRPALGGSQEEARGEALHQRAVRYWGELAESMVPHKYRVGGGGDVVPIGLVATDEPFQCPTCRNWLTVDVSTLSHDTGIPCPTVGCDTKMVRWQKDEDAKACNGCGHAFFAFRHSPGRWAPEYVTKSHCRLCGFVFCKRCIHMDTLPAPEGADLNPLANSQQNLISLPHLLTTPLDPRLSPFSYTSTEGASPFREKTKLCNRCWDEVCQLRHADVAPPPTQGQEWIDPAKVAYQATAAKQVAQRIPAIATAMPQEALLPAPLRQSESSEAASAPPAAGSMQEVDLRHPATVPTAVPSHLAEIHVV